VPAASDIEAVLDEAGVRVTKVTDTRIWAFCPVPDRHAGGVDNHPSWSMNPITGAHLCFSCGYRGSLRMLLEDLTGEFPRDLMFDIGAAASRRLIESIKQKEEEPEEIVPDHPYVSEAQLRAYSDVPAKVCALRNLDPGLVDMFGCRWNKKDRCWVIPVRGFDGKLLGWQQKAKGYFENIPPGMSKSSSLFGLELFHRGKAIIVESPLDVIRLATAGVWGGLSTYGVSVSDEQMEIVLSVSDEVVLALDNDKVGKFGTDLLWHKYHRRCTKMLTLHYRRDDPKDIGEFPSDFAIRDAVARAHTPRQPVRVYR
jgi:hypothetical protein